MKPAISLGKSDLFVLTGVMKVVYSSFFHEIKQLHKKV